MQLSLASSHIQTISLPVGQEGGQCPINISQSTHFCGQPWEQVLHIMRFMVGWTHKPTSYIYI